MNNNKEFTQTEQRILKYFTRVDKINKNQAEKMEKIRSLGRELCLYAFKNIQISDMRNDAAKNVLRAVMQFNLALAHDPQPFLE